MSCVEDLPAPSYKKKLNFSFLSILGLVWEGSLKKRSCPDTPAPSQWERILNLSFLPVLGSYLKKLSVKPELFRSPLFPLPSHKKNWTCNFVHFSPCLNKLSGYPLPSQTNFGLVTFVHWLSRCVGCRLQAIYAARDWWCISKSCFVSFYVRTRCLGQQWQPRTEGASSDEPGQVQKVSSDDQGPWFFGAFEALLVQTRFHFISLLLSLFHTSSFHWQLERTENTAWNLYWSIKTGLLCGLLHTASGQSLNIDRYESVAGRWVHRAFVCEFVLLQHMWWWWLFLFSEDSLEKEWWCLQTGSFTAARFGLSWRLKFFSLKHTSEEWTKSHKRKTGFPHSLKNHFQSGKNWRKFRAILERTGKVENYLENSGIYAKNVWKREGKIENLEAKVSELILHWQWLLWNVVNTCRWQKLTKQDGEATQKQETMRNGLENAHKFLESQGKTFLFKSGNPGRNSLRLAFHVESSFNHEHESVKDRSTRQGDSCKRLWQRLVHRVTSTMRWRRRSFPVTLNSAQLCFAVLPNSPPDTSESMSSRIRGKRAVCLVNCDTPGCSCKDADLLMLVWWGINLCHHPWCHCPWRSLTLADLILLQPMVLSVDFVFALPAVPPCQSTAEGRLRFFSPA